MKPTSSKTYEHECEACGKNCQCPPLVCKAGNCKHSYAVVFASKSCHHCKKMWPVVEKLRKDGYIVFYIDTENYPGVFEKFKLRVWPTTIVMEGGKPKVRFDGVTTAEQIAKHLKTRKEQGLQVTKKDTK